jgi:thioredoxin 1|tara:strand:+ start:685 stop:1044 length:360 start_codon:yes stop_codon:yes gene_type:complete
MCEYCFNIVNLDDFNDIIKKNKVVIVKASAEWCGPCKTIVDLFNELLDGLSGDVVVVLIDYDKAEDIRRKLRIRSIPFIANFINGEMLDTVNSSNKSDIKKFFAKTNKRYEEILNNKNT